MTVDMRLRIRSLGGMAAWAKNRGLWRNGDPLVSTVIKNLARRIENLDLRGEGGLKGVYTAAKAVLMAANEARGDIERRYAKGRIEGFLKAEEARERSEAVWKMREKQARENAP